MIDYYDHIDDYVNGMLTGAKLDAFEAAMSEDSELASAVANHDVAMGVIGSLMEDEVRGVIGEVEGEESVSQSQSENTQNKNIQLPQKGRVISMKFLLSIAAASVIGIVGFWGFGEYQYNQMEGEIFAQYVPILKVPNSKGGELTELTNLKDSIYFYYSTDQYDIALFMIDQYPSDQQLSDEETKLNKRIKVYSLFHQKDYQKAFDELAINDPLENDDRELLYHILVLLDRKEEAREQVLLLSLDRRKEIMHLSE
ncbi:MAG: hypothetical protein ACI86M_002391 [Saprospiraceae bacterium]|jgi:hypothetical protein